MASYAEREIEFYELMVREQTEDGKSHVSRAAKPYDWLADLNAWESNIGVASGDPHIGKMRSPVVERAGYVLYGSLWRAPTDQAEMVDLLALRRVRRGDGGYVILNFVTGEEEVFVLDEDEGIAHETHVAFFPDNVIGVIRNGRSAPNTTHIAQFLAEKLALRQLSVEPLLFSTEAARIAPHGTRVYDATMRIPPTAAELASIEAAEGDEAAAAATYYGYVRQQATELFGASVKVELRIYTAKTGPIEAKDAIKEFTETVEHLDDAYRPQKTRVKAIEDGMASAFDLAKNAITRKAQVTLEPVTGIAEGPLVFQPGSTSGKLKRAYQDLRDEVTKAAHSTMDAGSIPTSSWRGESGRPEEAGDEDHIAG